MINKDIVYIFSFLLIIINLLIYKREVPEYFKNNIVFKLIFLIWILYLAHINIYLGVFLGITFLSLNQ
jgi:hypothetical protein